jgi:protein-disulfide isomerase
MSQANRVGKQNARERVAAEKLRQRKADRRRKQLTIGGVTVGVIAIAASIGIAVSVSKHNAGVFAAPVGAVVDPVTKSTQDLGIRVGSADAPVTMTVLEDFRCPICQQDEAAVESTYKQYISDGKLQVIYHPVHLIDNNNGGSGSVTGGNAAACAQDSGQFMPMHDLLYANQPDEKTDGYGDKKTILALADQIPALKADSGFAACVNSGKHNVWVNKNHDAFNAIHAQGTPTFFINGTQLTLQRPQPAADDTDATYTPKMNASYQQQFKTALDAAFTKAGGKAGTPFTVPTVPAPSASGTPAPSASGSASGTPAATPSAGSSTPSASSSTTKS